MPRSSEIDSFIIELEIKSISVPTTLFRRLLFSSWEIHFAQFDSPELSQKMS